MKDNNLGSYIELHADGLRGGHPFCAYLNFSVVNQPQRSRRINLMPYLNNLPQWQRREKRSTSWSTSRISSHRIVTGLGAQLVSAAGVLLEVSGFPRCEG